MKTLIGITLAAFLLAPTIGRAQAAEVICKDATTSEGGRGACSGHGGIDKAATAKAEADKAAAEKATKAEAKTKAKKEKEEAKARKEAEKAEKAASEKAAKAEAKSAKAKDKVTKEADAAESAAMVTCKDGTTSKGGRGACRGHGGVDKGGAAKGAGAAAEAAAPAASEKAERAAKRAEKPAAAVKEAKPARDTAGDEKADPAKGPPTARCKDGTLSYSEHHTGACSRHGGVEEWLDKK